MTEITLESIRGHLASSVSLFVFAYFTHIPLSVSLSSLNCFYVPPSAPGSLGLDWLLASTYVQNKGHQKCIDCICSLEFSVAFADSPGVNSPADLEVLCTEYVVTPFATYKF